MKTVAMLSALLICSLGAFAQNKDVIDSQRDNIEDAYSYETTDPFGNSVTVFVDPPVANPVNHPWDNPDHPMFRGYEIEEEDKFDQKAVATVDVYVVADEEYRAAYSNWQNKLYNIIETADNAYYRDHQINWVIRGYYSWTSNGGNSSAILSDLASDGSGLPSGLVQGFTRDANFSAGGIAYVYTSNPGTGYSVCKDQGDSSTTYALRHEIGHNYGASHDFGSVVCFMNYTYAYSVDYFDQTHKNLVNAHQGWF